MWRPPVGVFLDRVPRRQRVPFGSLTTNMGAEDQFITVKQFTYEEEMGVCEHVLGEVEKRSTTDVVAKSTRYLYLRMLNGVRTLHVLSGHAQHEWAVDGGGILRTIHDAMLQLLWLLRDPGRREPLAAMYLHYLPIDKLRMLSAIGESETDAAVLWDKHCPEANSNFKRDLTKFGPQFLTKEGRRQHRKRGDSYLCDPKAKYRPHWYPGHLHDLAEDVRYVGEYKILHRDTSAGVHASVWALFRDPALDPDRALQCGLRFCLRAAVPVTEALGIHLADDELVKTRYAKVNIYNEPKLS